MFFGAAGAAQTAKINDFRPAQTTMYKKPKCALGSQVYLGRGYRTPMQIELGLELGDPQEDVRPTPSPVDF